MRGDAGQQGFPFCLTTSTHTPVVCVPVAGSSPELLFYPPWLHSMNKYTKLRELTDVTKCTLSTCSWKETRHKIENWEESRGLCRFFTCAQTKKIKFSCTHTACWAPSAFVTSDAPVGSSWAAGDTVGLAHPFIEWQKYMCVREREREKVPCCYIILVLSPLCWVAGENKKRPQIN